MVRNGVVTARLVTDEGCCEAWSVTVRLVTGEG